MVTNFLKLIWKGKFNGFEDLKVDKPPKNAIAFEEPESAKDLAKETRRSLIPVIVFLIIVIFLRGKIRGAFKIGDILNIFGVVLVIISILPHEYFHALAFPRDAEVEFWYSFKQRTALVISKEPITKRRFIFLNLLPNIVFGFLPLIIWIFIPNNMSFLSGTLFTFGFIDLIIGAGDFMNVYNAIKQVPKEALIQISAFDSYWFYN